MHNHHQELTKHLNTELSLAAFTSFLEAVVAQFGFDEGTIFETVLEEGDGHRLEGETPREQLPRFLTEEIWPRLRQVILSNQWIKGMNVKLHWIRRLHGSTLTVAWDLDEPGRAPAVAAVLEAALETLAKTAATSGAHSQTEELERLFGSMLLVESVARASRDAFLAGDFRACLAAAHRVLEKRLATLLGAPVKKMGDLEELFRREPPCFLLPELSGPRLQMELTGLVRVLSGLELLLQPLLRGKEKAPSDPAAVLKKLVLISLLVERLETATRNPAAMLSPKARGARPAAQAKPKRAPVKKTGHKGALHKLKKSTRPGTKLKTR